MKEALDKLRIPADIYMRDYQFTTTSGKVNLHPTKGTHTGLYSLMIITLTPTVAHLQ